MNVIFLFRYSSLVAVEVVVAMALVVDVTKWFSGVVAGLELLSPLT